MDAIQKSLLEQVAGLHEVPEGAYNIRANGQKAGRNTTANIDIVTKTDKDGIDIIIKPGTKNESVHIPVVLSMSGLKDMVYNDFFIGEDSDVTIIAGCGIHNCGVQASEHSGIHTFHVGKNARVRYVEKHYGEGDGSGENIMNPTTVVEMEEGGYMEMETTQIKGVDSTVRTTTAKLGPNATLIIKEKVMTHGRQLAKSDFTVDLDGEGCHTNVISRSVARTSPNRFSWPASTATPPATAIPSATPSSWTRGWSPPFPRSPPTAWTPSWSMRPPSGKSPGSSSLSS